MLKKVVLVLLVLFVGASVYVGMQPSEYKITREIFIRATPEVVFPHINNSKKCTEWMPWKDEDPAVVTTFSGPEEGVGSVASWTSTGNMGVGRSEVVESVSPKSVKTNITYEKPMSMAQISVMTLTPTSDGVVLRWEVTGNNTFMGRFMCLFFNMDKFVGGLFEKGLQNLKTKIEIG